MDQDELDILYEATREKCSIQKIKEHFTGGTSDAEAFAERELGQLRDKELTELVLAEYLKVCEEAKAIAKQKETLRAELIALAGQERGAIQRGKHVLVIEDRAARVTGDYEAYIKDVVGEKAWKQLLNDIQLVKDGKASCSWVKVGKASVEIEVKKVTG